MNASLPSVSVVMPVRNEERHLRAAVQRVLAQDYAGDFDVTLAVGPSRDATADVAEALAAEFANVHVVSNPSGSTPAGLNAAIGASSGEIVVRVDGHAMIPTDYVTRQCRPWIEPVRTTSAASWRLRESVISNVRWLPP
ncbi:MAG: hypothetical protein RLZZ163_1463 [Actinomycetota bacterium]